MTEDELSLWERYMQGDEAAREELILSYLYLVKACAKRISFMMSWANQEDLMQDGVIGLIKAAKRFDPKLGVEFKYFATPYIRGAIFDSSEITRELARRQQEIYGKIKRADAELTRILQRSPTIDEVAEKTGLSINQIQNAIDAMGVAFAGELSDTESSSTPSTMVEAATQERSALIEDALSRLSEREQSIIISYYLEGQSHEEIAQKLGLSVGNVIKIRQRALKKLRQLLG